MEEKISVEITGGGGGAIVAFRPTSISDTEEIAAASKQIEGFIEKNHPKRIVFDFERVKFFSSQLLGLLLEIRTKLLSYNGDVVISAINPRLQKVFEVTNLDKVFKFFPDKKRALGAAGMG